MSGLPRPSRAEIAEHAAVQKRFAEICEPEPMYAVVGDPETIVPRRKTHSCGACGGTGREWRSPKACHICLGSGRLHGTDPYVWPVPVVLVEPEAVEGTPAESCSPRTDSAPIGGVHVP